MPNQVVSREEWLAARVKLLVQEKEFTRRRDELSRRRRELPWVRIDDYPFRWCGRPGAGSPTCFAAARSSSSTISCSIPIRERRLQELRVLGRQIMTGWWCICAGAIPISSRCRARRWPTCAFRQRMRPELERGVERRRRGVQPSFGAVRRRGRTGAGTAITTDYGTRRLPTGGSAGDQRILPVPTAASTTPIRPIRAASTCSMAPTTISTSSPRACDEDGLEISHGLGAAAGRVWCVTEVTLQVVCWLRFR